MKALLAAVLIAPLVLAGCGAAEGADPAPTVTVTETVTAPPEVVEGEPVGAEEPAETQKPATGVVAFGETVTLPDQEGTITISAPEPYTPSEIALGLMEGEWDEFVVMNVTETNDGAEPVSAGWSMSATTGEQEAEQIYDSGNGIEAPLADVMPGKSITYKIAFGRTAGADFVLSASPLAGWNKAYFQG